MKMVIFTMALFVGALAVSSLGTATTNAPDCILPQAKKLADTNIKLASCVRYCCEKIYIRSLGIYKCTRWCNSCSSGVRG